ncbi:MAG: hypothetical protein AAGD10_16725 [Myxococcota bacterium]
MRAFCLVAFLALVGPFGPSPSAHAAETARTGVEFSVEPGSVEIQVNGKSVGRAKDVSFVKLAPGRHKVRLVRGGDEIQLELQVSKGQVVQFTYEF